MARFAWVGLVTGLAQRLDEHSGVVGHQVRTRGRVVEWEQRERVVRGAGECAQRLTEKGQQGQDLKSVDIGAMAKADCASC